MLNDMLMRNFTYDTQRECIRAVKKLVALLNRLPDPATAEELRAFSLHPTETGANPPVINTTVTALRFYFKTTRDKPETTRHLVFVHEPRRLPRVLPPEDVLRLLEAAPNRKAKVAVYRAQGRARVSLTLHPSGRHPKPFTGAPLTGNSAPRLVYI
jgi:integrase/recombinase XerD